MHPLATTDHFEQITPRDPSLRAIVSHYYFHHCEAPGTILHFSYYPHYKHALTVYRDSKMLFNDAAAIVHPGKRSDVVPIFSRIQKQACSVSMEAPFHKVGIVFQALGFNRLLVGKLRKTYPAPISQVDLPLTDWPDPSLLWSASLETRAHLLDIWVKKQIKVTNTDRFHSVVHQLIEQPGEQQLQQLAQENFTSPKTLARWFGDHLGCSFSTFKKICRFRLALHHHQQQSTDSLTRLALLANYYDQPDFNRNIKQLTGDQAGVFLKGVQQLGQGTFWTFR